MICVVSILSLVSDPSPYLFQFRNYELNGEARADLLLLMAQFNSNLDTTIIATPERLISGRVVPGVMNAPDGFEPCLGFVHHIIGDKSNRLLLFAVPDREAFNRFLDAERQARPGAKIEGDGTRFRSNAPPLEITEDGVKRSTTFQEICYQYQDGIVLVGGPSALIIDPGQLAAEIERARKFDAAATFVPDRIPKATAQLLLQSLTARWGVVRQVADHESHDTPAFLFRHLVYSMAEEVVSATISDVARLESITWMPRLDQPYHLRVMAHIKPGSGTSRLVRELLPPRRRTAQFHRQSAGWGYAHLTVPKPIAERLSELFIARFGEETQLERVLVQTIRDRVIDAQMQIEQESVNQTVGSASVKVSAEKIDANQLGFPVNERGKAEIHLSRVSDNLPNYLAEIDVRDGRLTGGFRPETGEALREHEDAAETERKPLRALAEFYLDVAAWRDSDGNSGAPQVFLELIRILQTRSESSGSALEALLRTKKKKQIHPSTTLKVLEQIEESEDWTIQTKLTVSPDGTYLELDCTVGQHLFAWFRAHGLHKAVSLSNGRSRPTPRQIIKLAP